MARFKVTHSEDACCIQIKGDKRNPEPTTAVIRFPGGFVEVSRCSDGSYWAHLCRYDSAPDDESPAGRIVGHRLDYSPESGLRDVQGLPQGEHITQMAIRVAAGAANE